MRPFIIPSLPGIHTSKQAPKRSHAPQAPAEQPAGGITGWLHRLAEAPAFDTFIIMVILFASMTVGLETYPEIVAAAGGLLHAFDAAIIWIFVAEVAIKIGAHGRRPWRYFANPWNVFDFAIVVVASLPIHSNYTAVLRLVRILRVLRLVKAPPRLRVIVDALIKSFSAMGYISLLLTVHFYIFATLGTSLFSRNDPVHFGSLQSTFLTLFQILTMDSWVEIMDIQAHGAAASAFYQGRESAIVESMAWPLGAPLYFVAFVLLGTMIILNLFIGVITNGMSEAQREMAGEDEPRDQRPELHAASPDGAALETATKGSAGHSLIITSPADAASLSAYLSALSSEVAKLRRRLTQLQPE